MLAPTPLALLGTVAGTVWNDQDGDGTRDTSEAAQSGWVVYADTNKNGQRDRNEPAALSGRDGSYRLSLAAGTYTIREQAVSGWQVTRPANGPYSVTVAARRTVTGRDFGNQQAVGTVSGVVWNDLDGDSTRDAGEAGLAGWQVYVDANSNGRYDSGERAATSRHDGSYQLTLTAGTVVIRETLPSGWQATAPSSGSYSVTVTSAAPVTGKDFGNRATTTSTPGSSGEFDIDLTFVGLTASQEAIADQAAARWEAVIVGDLPDVRYRGTTIDDVSITISFESIDGSGNILGEAGPEALRSGSSLPYRGSVIIDTADAAALESDGELLDVLTHEIGHVLGLGTIWDIKGLLSGTRSNPIFTGSQATAAYNELFGTQASGVPVEATGGSGTALAHWREAVFVNELMVGTIHSGGMALRTVTVASMADLGYTVNMAAAEPYTPTVTNSSRSRTTSTSSGISTATTNTYPTSPAYPGRSMPRNPWDAVEHLFRMNNWWWG